MSVGGRATTGGFISRLVTRFESTRKKKIKKKRDDGMTSVALAARVMCARARVRPGIVLKKKKKNEKKKKKKKHWALWGLIRQRSSRV